MDEVKELVSLAHKLNNLTSFWDYPSKYKNKMIALYRDKWLPEARKYGFIYESREINTFLYECHLNYILITELGL